MSGTLSPLADLFRQCDARGVVLRPVDSGALAIEGPSVALTPEFIHSLKARKNDILLVLMAECDLAAGETAAVQKLAIPNGPTPDAICRCGSTVWHDIAIHDGQSVRRDCARCGRFLGWLQWYGCSVPIAVEKPTATRKEVTDG